MNHSRLTHLGALLLALVLMLGASPLAFAAGAPMILISQPPLTRAQARDLIAAAADDYGSATAADILRGYPDGDLREQAYVTRAEALVMLARAFGTLRTPVGESARAAYPVHSFSDLPQWAADELASVLAAGVVVGQGDGTLGASLNVTADELDTLLRRVFALQASNLKDDFYAAVNLEWLDTAELLPGYGMNGTLYELTASTNADVAALITEIAASRPAEGTPENMIRDLYATILDTEGRTAAGIEPLRGYLDAIDGANSLDALMAVHNRILSETTVASLLGFGITQELVNSERKALSFGVYGPSLTREYYQNETVATLYLQYLTGLQYLGGSDMDTAFEAATAILTLESELAAAALTAEPAASIGNSYNVVPVAEVKALFPAIDLDAVRACIGLPARESCVIGDTGLTATFAAHVNENELPLLKALMRHSVLASLGGLLTQDFADLAAGFNAALLGYDPSVSPEDAAASAVQAYLPDYLGRAYVERHFSARAKAGAEKMIDDMLAVYKQRLANLSWMSPATRAKAIEKLDAITINVGYPDVWADPYAGVPILGPEEGGSYYGNIIAMSRASLAQQAAAFDQPINKAAWITSAYTVNAFYSATANSINFPAGILQAPLYDVNADYTENLGGIGYIIAHEITHAFDNNGAQFDASGNQSNWWTEEDYAAFQSLCADVVAFYDGVEAIPGVACNGTLTLSENVADLGALACITQIESAERNPDYRTLYTAASATWRSAASREIRQYYSYIDSHAPDKLRGNRALQSLDEFYTAFDIRPGDGMYLPPEARVRVW